MEKKFKNGRFAQLQENIDWWSLWWEKQFKDHREYVKWAAKNDKKEYIQILLLYATPFLLLVFYLALDSMG